MSNILEYPLTIRYNINRPLCVEDVIASLDGLSKLLPGTLPFLRAYDKKHGPIGVTCYVSAIKQGSLRDDILARFFFNTPEDARAWVQAVKDKTGISDMERRFPMLHPILKLALIGGAIWGLKSLGVFGGVDASRQITLEAGAQAIIADGNVTIGLPQEQLASLFKKAQKKKNANAASTFVRPSQTGAGPCSIDLIGEGDEATRLLEATEVAAIPSTFREEDEQTLLSQELEDTELNIRACDMDQIGRGWFAIVPAVSDRRLPIRFPNGFDRSNLGPAVYRADVTLEYVRNAGGDRTYRQINLRAIRPNTPTN